MSPWAVGQSMHPGQDVQESPPHAASPVLNERTCQSLSWLPCGLSRSGTFSTGMACWMAWVVRHSCQGRWPCRAVFTVGLGPWLDTQLERGLGSLQPHPHSPGVLAFWG